MAVTAQLLPKDDGYADLLINNTLECFGWFSGSNDIGIKIISKSVPNDDLSTFIKVDKSCIVNNEDKIIVHLGPEIINPLSSSDLMIFDIELHERNVSETLFIKNVRLLRKLSPLLDYQRSTEEFSFPDDTCDHEIDEVTRDEKHSQQIHLFQQTQNESNQLKIEPEREPCEAEAKKKGTSTGSVVALILIVLLLGICGFAYWFFILNKNVSSDSETNSAEPLATNADNDTSKPQEDVDANTSESAKAETPIDKGDLETANSPSDDFEIYNSANADAPVSSYGSECTLSEKNDLVLMKKCLTEYPNDVDLIKFIEEALQNQRCDLAKRILIGKARKGSELIAYTYGKYLDPNEATNSSCIEKNKDQAAIWYKKAPNNAQAAANLERLK